MAMINIYSYQYSNSMASMKCVEIHDRLFAKCKQLQRINANMLDLNGKFFD